MNEKSDDEIFQYGDPRIASANAPVPRWLNWSYVIWTLFGFVWWYFFWNGSYGWLDRGYWNQLQKAAKTTFPFPKNNIEDIKEQNDRDYPTKSY